LSKHFKKEQQAVLKVTSVPRVDPSSRTSPTKALVSSRERCHRLVVLEQRLSRQRKLIADLKTRGLDASLEQGELARLLAELDWLLGKPPLEVAPAAAAS
jgi:hypothetical protein